MAGYRMSEKKMVFPGWKRFAWQRVLCSRKAAKLAKGRLGGPVGSMGEGLNRRDSATRHTGTFPKIWPGCFGWRARLWGVFQQIAEIGSGAGP